MRLVRRLVRGHPFFRSNALVDVGGKAALQRTTGEPPLLLSPFAELDGRGLSLVFAGDGRQMEELRARAPSQSAGSSTTVESAAESRRETGATATDEPRLDRVTHVTNIDSAWYIFGETGTSAEVQAFGEAGRLIHRAVLSRPAVRVARTATAVYVSDLSDRVVSLSGAEQTSLRQAAPVLALTSAADDRFLVVGTSDGGVSVLDPSGVVVSRAQTTEPVVSIVEVPDAGIAVLGLYGSVWVSSRLDPLEMQFVELSMHNKPHTLVSASTAGLVGYLGANEVGAFDPRQGSHRSVTIEGKDEPRSAVSLRGAEIFAVLSDGGELFVVDVPAAVVTPIEAPAKSSYAGFARLSPRTMIAWTANGTLTRIASMKAKPLGSKAGIVFVAPRTRDSFAVIRSVQGAIRFSIETLPKEASA
jgi:hypothetical protein